MKIPVLVLFVLMYILLLIFAKRRALIAFLTALIFIIFKMVPPLEIFTIIDWNVLLMIAGTMGVVTLFIESEMPSLLADIIIEKMYNVKWTIIALALFAGIISAFVDNVATVLMVAPVAVTISKKLKISPVPSVIAIAVSSNLQGAATLVGDTTSIMLGGEAGMNFMNFFWYKGHIGIFWVVEAGALVSVFILLWIFRKQDQDVNSFNRTQVNDYFPSVLLVGIVVLLILASFIEDKPAITNGIICMSVFAVGLIRVFIIKKKTGLGIKAIKSIDFDTILLLGSLFIVIGGLSEAGIITDIGDLFIKLGGNNKLVIYTLIVWASVLISAFIDNIPYTATMLPVVTSIANAMNMDPTLFYFGLLIGATLGGNLTPIGASANITGIGILRKEGHEVSTKDFMKISVPFTLSAVITGYVLLWIIWA